MIFPTNQSKRTSDNARTNEISRQQASERRVNESDISFESF